MALIPPLCPPGVNVTMPAQPGMPPVSSTQLQIDTTLQEFQLVDLSRRFLVHDSFWALPEQFLGNKVKGPPRVGRGPVPPASMLGACLGSAPSKAGRGASGQSLSGRGVLMPSFIQGRVSARCGQDGRRADAAFGKTLLDHSPRLSWAQWPTLVSLGTFYTLSSDSSPKLG